MYISDKMLSSKSLRKIYIQVIFTVCLPNNNTILAEFQEFYFLKFELKSARDPIKSSLPSSMASNDFERGTASFVWTGQIIRIGNVSTTLNCAM